MPKKERKKVTTESVEETELFAARLAADLAGERTGRPIVLALTGDLGAGKTAFTRGFLRALGVRKNITSPTFVVMRRFSLPSKSAFTNAYHMDAYRVSAEDAGPLGLLEIMNDPKSVLIIEWADRLGAVVPSDAIRVECTYGKRENERVFIVDR